MTTQQQQEDSYLAAETAVYLRLKFNLSYEESDFLSIFIACLLFNAELGKQPTFEELRRFAFEQPEFAAAKISDKTLELIDYLAENYPLILKNRQNQKLKNRKV